MIALYARVLSMLRAESGLAALLVFANIFVAVAQFAEPLLFGRMIDLLTKGAGQSTELDLTTARPMMFWLALVLSVKLLAVGLLTNMNAPALDAFN